MEKVALILVGKGAPKILSQLRELKIGVKGDVQAIQDDLDALQRCDDRDIMSKAKIEHGRGRVMRYLTQALGHRCVLRNMKGDI